MFDVCFFAVSLIISVGFVICIGRITESVDSGEKNVLVTLLADMIPILMARPGYPSSPSLVKGVGDW